MDGSCSRPGAQRYDYHSNFHHFHVQIFCQRVIKNSCNSQICNILCIGNKEWHSKSGHYKFRQKKENRKNVNEAVRTTTQTMPSPKSSYIYPLMDHIRMATSGYTLLSDHFLVNRKDRFTTYVLEKKAEDSLIKKLVRHQKNVVIGWGSGSEFMANPKVVSRLGGEPAPVKKFYRAVQKHRSVKCLIRVDEYLTSQMCPICNNQYVNICFFLSDCCSSLVFFTNLWCCSSLKLKWNGTRSGATSQ